jgi:hypothetical protein
MEPSVPLAVGEAGWVIVVVALLLLAGVIYGFFTRHGSGIDQHRHGGDRGATGATGKSEVSGKDEGEGSTLDTHGTR